MRIEWSGVNWYLDADDSPSHRSIEVIEAPGSSSPKKGSGKKKARKVPFGFARALPSKPKKKPRKRRPVGDKDPT